MIGWYEGLKELVEEVLGQFYTKESSSVGRESASHSGSKSSPQSSDAIGGDRLPHAVQEARVGARRR